MSSRDKPKTFAEVREEICKRREEMISRDNQKKTKTVAQVREEKGKRREEMISRYNQKKAKTVAQVKEGKGKRREEMISRDNRTKPKTVAQVRDAKRKRIFDHVPRGTREPHAYLRNDPAPQVASVPKSVPEEKDVILDRILSNVPRRKKTTSYEFVPPKHPQEPQWLLQVMSRMNGAGDPKLIIEKTLDSNDVDPRQNRLSIPINSVIQNDFLTLDESRLIDEDEITNEGNMGVAAFLVDQLTKKWNMGFKQWFMTTDSGSSYWSFVLRGEWSNIVETNGLKEGDKISLWSFRSNEILCFALVPPTSSVVKSLDK
ncbi:B3 domain-containing protein [Arabidopsis thaliana]